MSNKDTVSNDNDNGGFAFLQRDIVCSNTDKGQYQRAGYYWTASPHSTYSPTPNCSQI